MVGEETVEKGNGEASEGAPFMTGIVCGGADTSRVSTNAAPLMYSQFPRTCDNVALSNKNVSVTFS